MKLQIEKVNNYFEYQYETINTLPTYTSAQQGLDGINGISFSPADMYFCVGKTQHGVIKDYATYDVIWSFGQLSEFQLNSHEFRGYGANMSHHAANLRSISGSDDGFIWETITEPDTKYRKYYKFTFGATEAGRWGKMGFTYFNFTGTRRTKVYKSEETELYDEVTKARAIVQEKIQYYDYEYKTLDSLPTYSSVAEAEDGKDDISFKPGSIYFCVAKAQNGTLPDVDPYNVDFSFGEHNSFKMDSYSYTGYGANMSHHPAQFRSISASDDGVTWETVTLPDTKYRKYYRFTWGKLESWGKYGFNYFNFKGTRKNRVKTDKRTEIHEIVEAYYVHND